MPDERSEIDWKALAGLVGQLIWGEPTFKSATELRWGKSGSKSVNLVKGSYFNHETQEGGGVLDLIKNEAKIGDRKEQMKWLAENGLIEQRERATSGKGKGQAPAAIYDYTDEKGKLRYQVCRFEPGRERADGTRAAKDFRQRQPDGLGGWKWSIKGLTFLPYRLPELLEDIAAGETVFIVEGEKDVDRLRSMNVPATCNNGGAGGWSDPLSPWLKGADVVLIEDNDEPGREHVIKTARSLAPFAKRIRRLTLSRVWAECPEKGDVSDWFATGAGVEQLYHAIAGYAQLWEPEPFETQFGAISYRDMDQPWPEHEWLVKKCLARGEVSLMAGPSGSGKTFEALNLGMSVATGRAFHGFKVTKPGLVIYQAGESGRGMMKRWRAYRDDRKIPRDADVPFVLLTLPLDLYSSDEATEKLIAECRGHAVQYKEPLELIVVDTLAAATAGANENTSEDMGPVLARCGRICRTLKCAVLLVHHMNADGAKVRGWTGIQANVDGVITIRRGETQECDDDNRFIRYGKLTKMKDGEDGIEWRFVLRNVEVGRDSDGDPITTCVVAPPNQPNLVSPEIVKPSRIGDKGFILNPTEMVMLEALAEATREHGAAPADMLNAPEGARIVAWIDWRRAYENKSFEHRQADGTLDEKTIESLRKKLGRFGAKAMTFGLIRKHANSVWLTGKQVAGMRMEWFPTVRKKEREFVQDDDMENRFPLDGWESPL